MNINEEFIKKLYISIKTENNVVYKDMFDNAEINSITDPVRKSAFKLYKNLSNEDRGSLLKIINDVELNVVSNILGIIDGHIIINGCDVKPRLLLNEIYADGNLQELFLSFAEVN